MSEINIPEWVTNRDKSLDTNICPECLHMYQIHIAYPHAGGCHDCLCTRTYQSLISSVRKQTIGMTERITELTAEPYTEGDKMSEEQKALMAASMIRAIESEGFTASEIDCVISELDDLRDSIDTELHDALREAMNSPIVRVIPDREQLTAERDKYRDACERLVATGANLVKVIEAATVIETMFVMGNRKDKAFQEVEQIVGAKNLLKRQLADAVDFARQVKAELEGIEGSEIEVGVE